MTTIQQLRELEKAATLVYERATKLEYDTGDGKEGDVRVWSKHTAGRCVAVFRGDNAQPTADAYIALRNAAPHLFAVVEAAEGLEDHQDNFCECHLLTKGQTCPICLLVSALADFRNAK